MKNIKISIIALLLIITSQSFAQVITIEGGTNFSNMTNKDNEGSYNDENELKLGYHIGVTAEFEISQNLFFETGLFYTTRGVKSESQDIVTKSTGTLNLKYLNAPFNVKYKTSLTDKLKLYASTGMYFGYGLDGNYKLKITDQTGELFNDVEVNENIQWGNNESNDDFKRADFGFNLGGGLEFNKVKIGATYALGLYNIVSNTNNGNIARNKAWLLSVGYRIGK